MIETLLSFTDIYYVLPIPTFPPQGVSSLLGKQAHN
jgi:hypothetical protein